MSKKNTVKEEVKELETKEASVETESTTEATPVEKESLVTKVANGAKKAGKATIDFAKKNWKIGVAAAAGFGAKVVLDAISNRGANDEDCDLSDEDYEFDELTELETNSDDTETTVE